MNIEDIIRSSTKRANKVKDDGIVIENNREAKEVDWEDIKIWKKPERIEKPIDNWKTWDFVSYCRFIYFNKYKEDWKLVRKSACAEILRLKDKLVDAVGYCDNDLLKTYIDYYFRHAADRVLRKQKVFIIAQMIDYDLIARFYRLYKGDKKPIVENKEKDTIIDPRNMENLFLLSHERFVMEYGINLSIHYMIKYQSLNPKEAVALVIRACRKIYNSGKISSVVNATEKYSPYPKWLAFNRADALIKQIDGSASINVKTSVGSKKFSLLKR